MSNTADQAWLGRILSWPVRHRLLSTILLLGALALAGLSINQLRIDSRLESMFAGDSASSEALTHVLRDFRGMDELLVLIEVPAGDSRPPAQRVADLRAYAERFKQTIEQDAEAGQLVRQVTFGAGDSIDRFARDIIGPAAVYYLDDARRAQFRERITPEGMRRQIKRNERMMALPDAAVGGAGQMMLKDPLHLYELVVPSVQKMRPPFRTWRDSDAYISPDASAILVRIVGRRSAGDSVFAEQLMRNAPVWAEAAEPGQLSVKFTGAYAIADYSRREIRNDLISCLTGSVGMILLLLIVVYRKPWLLSLALVPVAVGVLLAFGIYAAFWPHITPVTAAIGGILAGLSIDYAVHYLSHYELARFHGNVVQRAVADQRGMLAGLLGAAGTSVLAFAAIAISSVDLLRSFALLGSIGLACALLSTLWVLPTLLGWVDRRHHVADPAAGARVNVAAMIRWVDRHRKVWRMTAGLGVVAALFVAVMLVRGVWLERDVSVMHPQPNPPLQTQERISDLFSTSSETLILHVEAPSSEVLQLRLKQVHERFSSDEFAEVVTDVFSPARLLPEDVEAVDAMLADIDRQAVIDAFQKAIEASVFSPEAFEPYMEYLETMLANDQPPGLGTLLAYPDLTGSMLPARSFETGASPRQALVMLSVTDQIENAEKRGGLIVQLQAAADKIEGATLTGIPVAGYEMQKAVQAQLPVMTAVAALLVLICGAWCLRGLKALGLAMLPVLFSVVCLLAVMQLSGWRFNLVNMLGMPILVGVTVDAGMFLTRGWFGSEPGRDDRTGRLLRLDASMRAILLCAGTTVLGFGSLMFARTPAVYSLGLLLVVGMIASLVGSLFLLVPILLGMQLPDDDARGTNH